MAALPGWIEQLVAESTGKNGKGIVPVADEPRCLPRTTAPTGCSSRSPSRASRSRNSPRRPRRSRRTDIPWSRCVLGKKPRPRRRSSSAGSWRLLPRERCSASSRSTSPMCSWRRTFPAGQWRRPATARQRHRPPSASQAAWREALSSWLSSVRAGDYVGIQAYLAPSAGVVEALKQLRGRLGRRAGVATTLGLGPGSSTPPGSCTRGDRTPACSCNSSMNRRPTSAVPETNYSFGQLIRAQAAGDAMALEQRGRRLLRINLGRDVVKALETLAAMI